VGSAAARSFRFGEAGLVRMIASDHPSVPAVAGGTSRDSSRTADDLLAFSSEAIEALPVGVLLVGADGIIARVNREGERLFGYAGPELIGHSVDILVPEGALLVSQSLRAFDAGSPALRAGTARQLFGRRKDGSEVAIEMAMTPTSFRGTRFVLTSVVDATARRGIPQATLQAALDERLEFERLIGELGAEFGSLRPAEVDSCIEDALGRLTRVLGLDRCALFQAERETGDFVHTHQWTRPGCAPPPPRVRARERFPWLLTRIRDGELVMFSTLDEVPDETDRDSFRQLSTKSNVTAPLMIGGEVWGALTFATVRDTRVWSAADVTRFRVVALMFANALARKASDERLHATLMEMGDLRDRLRHENSYLRHEVNALLGTSSVVGNSPAFRRVLDQIRQVAATESTVLLVGETGTGKTMLAGQIHELSARREPALIRVNCAHLSAAWWSHGPAASEPGLHVNGGAWHDDRLPLADGSTVFLDEIADLPLEAQANLSRAVQHGPMRRPGKGATARVPVRIIAATRKDLKRCIAEGSFRDDLYYRLNVFPIHVPPLRERREDIPLLVWRFVDEFSAEYGKPIDAIDQESMDALQDYAWPGNARELRNVVDRAMIAGTGRRLRIPPPAHDAYPSRPRGPRTLAAVEKAHIIHVVAACGGWPRARNRAAARLGLAPAALNAKVAELGLYGRSHV